VLTTQGFGGATLSSILSSEGALITPYVFVCDFLAAPPSLANWRRSKSSQPTFTDAEVLPLALMQGCLGCSTLKQTYLHIKHNHAQAFAHRIPYQRGIARLHALPPLVGYLVEAVLAKHPMPGRAYIADSKPVPACKLVRAVRARLLREEGASGGKSSTGWYVGFTLHLIQHGRGGILSVMLTPGNVSDPDPDVLVTLGSHLKGGLLLGDDGYQSHPLHPYLKAQAGMGWLTRPDVQNKARRVFLHQVRKRIQTSLSLLWRLLLDRVFSRSFLGLGNTLLLKGLHLNLRVAGILS
jgi:hypothetical protein